MSQELVAQPWFAEFRDVYGAGSHYMFCLHGDVYGQTEDGIDQISYLVASLASREIILRYNIASGFGFALPTMRKAANDLLGGASQSQPSSNGSALAAFGGGNRNTTVQTDWFSRPEKTIDALEVIEQLLTKEALDSDGALLRKSKEKHPKSAYRKIAVIIEQAELLCPQAEKSQMDEDQRKILAMLFRWGHTTEIERMEVQIFLCCTRPEEIHKDLRSSNSGIYFIDIQIPSREQRARYIEGYMERRAVKLAEGIDPDEIANQTAGLNLRQVEGLFMLGNKVGGLSRALITAQKRQVMKQEYSDVIAFLDPLPGGLSAIGGMEKVVAWMNEEVVGPVRRGSKRAPKGVLLVGPPGTGKTMLIQALAQDIGFNVLVLKASKFMSKFVGESERNLADFFRVARAVPPVLIFIDELDQNKALSQRGGDNDSGVSGNLFQEMLTFMSDPLLRGKVIVVAATNRADLLEPALIRPGRFGDAVYPLLLPDAQARPEIYRAQGRMQDYPISEEAVLYAAAESENFSAADIAAIVTKAGKIADKAGRGEIGVEDMRLALSYIKPAGPDQSQFFTNIAIAACTDKQWLPETQANKLDNRVALAESIAQEGRRIFPTDERYERGAREL